MQTSFVELNMQIADAPRLTKKAPKKSEFKNDDELKAFFGIE
tara:strand:+ start:1475 stop:1600 length:126 start_codon:yes stop_codon:yes gene_type:complete